MREFSSTAVSSRKNADWVSKTAQAVPLVMQFSSLRMWRCVEVKHTRRSRLASWFSQEKGASGVCDKSVSFVSFSPWLDGWGLRSGEPEEVEER